VRYTAAGTAAGGADYSALSGLAFFAFGSATTTVTVAPINDPAYEAVETIVLNLTDGETYDVGTVSSATVSLYSDDVGTAGFKGQSFAGNRLGSKRERELDLFFALFGRI
jgi:hypothetical protein